MQYLEDGTSHGNIDSFLLECNWENNMVFEYEVDNGFIIGPLLGSYVGFGYGIKYGLIFGLFIGYEV